MEFVGEYGLFLAKTLTVVLAVMAIAATIAAMGSRGRSMHREQLRVRHLNRKYEDLADMLRSKVMHPKIFKQAHKHRLRQRKAERKLQKGDGKPHRRTVFVLNFRGDLRAAAVASLREEVTAVLSVAGPEDEVLLRLESAGGLVHSYGLAASQLMRLKDRSLPLTVAVDKVAASGGYMMACVADRIIAAPFAIVGSIGVVAQLPNFNRLLKKHDIDFEMFTGGEHKRTVTLFGENTDSDRAKYREQIEDVHALFKEFVTDNRPAVDIKRVATGEHWFASRALELKLVDEIRTSDDYLMVACESANLYEVGFREKKSLGTRMMMAGDALLARFGGRSIRELEPPQLM